MSLACTLSALSPPSLLPPLPVMLRTLSSALVAFIQRDKFWFVSFLLSLCSYPLPHSLPDFLCLSCSLKGILNFVLSRTFHLLRTTFATGHLTPTHRAHMFLSLFLCLSCSLCVRVCVYVSLVNFIILCRVGFVVVCGKDVCLTLGDIINIKRRNRSEAADNKY